MLDTSGKLLERPKFTAAIENRSGLSARPYGFRPGRSTIDALRERTEVAMGHTTWLSLFEARATACDFGREKHI